MSQPVIFDPKSIQSSSLVHGHATNRIELLAPAKNAEFGKQAILHGADAVYIGGPAFGARAAAGNAIEDIAELAAFAHQYHAQVFVALNTILSDIELAQAEQIIWQIYEAGADALIVQDMGILQLNLPPIALHASTQMDNRTPEKAAFLQQVGFTQVVLARELNLAQIQAVAEKTQLQLEFFIHGALCVSYSGQCYISHAFTNRSANRGECSQMCRLPCNLKTREGEVLAANEHLLSLKDNNQTTNLEALINAGVRSFKIEGRLKDLSYVKNVTAHYRQQLDAIMQKRPELVASSHGRSVHRFQPDPDKSFNRGKTDYFVNERSADVSDFRTPKYLGESVGTVSKIGRDHFVIDSQHQFSNGDGFCFFDAKHSSAVLSDDKLQGLRINRADGKKLFVAKLPKDLQIGMQLYRNHDQAFESELAKDSSKRILPVRMALREADDGLALTISDEYEHQATVKLAIHKEFAQDKERSRKTLHKQLGKLGSTDFELLELKTHGVEQYFLPASVLNGLRRDAVAALLEARLQSYQRPPVGSIDKTAVYPEKHLSYLGNVANQKAKSFYQQHGVIQVEDAYEKNRVIQDAPLMITKHCLRYSFDLCPKEVPDIKADPMVLEMGNDTLKLVFDCLKCEMLVVGSSKQV
ncbi:peptidase U32 family protein [Shewanella gelidii]|uniref:Protease n=1 Tax=Shewanella gelidii TaxID=1642821 RepID=A0A917N6G5_9GAMM|nr:U32 family peptidase [Shewanella gelidii]MCL1096897.1 U32 family peptidase [Shewanella gelidii]GGI70990.1 protease [Shewanella gelidii]